MPRKIIILSLIIFVMSPMVVSAQEDLTETYTSDDTSLNFMYPSGWIVQGVDSLAVLTNDPEFSSVAAGETLPSGTVFAYINVGPWDDIAPNLVTNGDVNVMAAMESILNGPDAPEPIDGPAPLDIGNDAAYFVTQDSGNDLIVISIALNDEIGAIFVGGTTGGELDMFRDTLTAIAATITYNEPIPSGGTVKADDGPAATPGTGAVVWQQQRPHTTDGTGFAGLGEVDIAADGTIYVADEYYGIRQLDAEGNVIQTIRNNNINALGRLSLADDGTIWVMLGSSGHFYHLDAEGNKIFIFGELGPDPGQFGELGAQSFDIGPDGNLYVFDSQVISETENAGRIQVFDTEGNFLHGFTTDPNGEGKLTAYVEIGVAPNGNIYAADFTKNVTIFDPDGNILQESFAADALGPSEVASMDFGPDGSIYFATGDGLFVTDSEGALIAHFGMRQPRSDSGETLPLEPGEFSKVVGIAVAENGDAIVADTNYAHSQIIRISVEAAPAE